MDDIHSHWESYLHSFRVLADAPYSQFYPQEGWDVVYTWESLQTHGPTFTNSFGKKTNKPLLVVVVTPTTTEVGTIISSVSSTSQLASSGSRFISAPRCPEKGVVSKWSFPLLWSVISKCSLWLLPHLETPWTHVCMWSLYGVS